MRSTILAALFIFSFLPNVSADGGIGSLFDVFFRLTTHAAESTANASASTSRWEYYQRQRRLRHVPPEAASFAEQNLALLQRDIAAGDGEYVRTFVTLLAPKGKQDVLRQDLKAEYRQLFPNSGTTPDQFLR